MTNLELIRLELPRLRELATSANAEEASAWGQAATDALHFEIRWCIETLQELDVRLKAAAAQRS